jgi:hypothetical protein
MPSANHPQRARPNGGATSAFSASSANTVSRVSNITAPVKACHSSIVASSHGARRASRGCCGHSAAARRATSSSAAIDARVGRRRGHHSLTPNTTQPACISQNSSGGLSTYTAKFLCGTRKSPRSHISQATDR